MHASGYSNDVQAIHSVLLPNGRVLCWGAVAFDTDPNTCEVLLFNPADGSAIGVANKFGYVGDGDPDSTHGHDWFCAGHSHLPDGSVFLTGGGYTGGETSLYVPDPNGGKGNIVQGKIEQWHDPNDPNDPYPLGYPVNRFYPTVTTLPIVSGKARVLVTDGNINDCVAAKPDSSPLKNRHLATRRRVGTGLA